MTTFSDNSPETTVEQQAGSTVVPHHVSDDEHTAWMARVMAAVRNFEGMPEEIERDKTPPRDPPNFD